MISVEALKCIFFSIIFVITMFFGLLPIKVLSLIRERKSLHSFNQYLSIISCFSGGIFLGVCLLDMLPDALESYEEYLKAANTEYDFPIVPIIIGVGFFFIYLLDQVTSSCGGIEHSHDISSEGLTTNIVIDSEPNLNMTTTRENFIKSLAFVLAFLIHVSLEGFALGGQKEFRSEVTLFIGIILHKAMAAFSIGTRLIQNHPRHIGFVGAMLALVAVMTTVGGAIGMLIEEKSMETSRKAAIETVMTCISIGTFLYITFFEMLHVSKSTLSQRIAALIGFILIGISVVLSEMSAEKE